MDKARGEEAAQSDQQQQCILSGEVYLRHRLEKQAFSKNLLALLSLYKYYAPSDQGVTLSGVRRAGVQETVPLFD